LEPLSDIELYYFPSIEGSSLPQILVGEDSHHIINVMKHRVGSKFHITNGKGSLFEVVLLKILKNSTIEVIANIKLQTKPVAPLIFFYLPILKSSDRMEFALEKLVELGYTNFVYFRPTRAMSKSKLLNEERLNKIALSAMKQSLHLYTPQLEFDYMLDGLPINDECMNIIFESWGSESLQEMVDIVLPYINNARIVRFFFGPEGGLHGNEINKIAGARIVQLTESRLRSETAVIYVGSVLRNYILKGIL